MALLLDELRSADGAAEAGARAWRLAEAMYPLCRSLTGAGVWVYLRHRDVQRREHTSSEAR